MKPQPKHTPRPQSLEFPLSLSNHPVSNEEVVLHDADGMRIAIFELESEAAYTLRAVNAYGLLVEALKETLYNETVDHPHSPWLNSVKEKAAKALALADGVKV
jgi:hypothetical protein